MYGPYTPVGTVAANEEAAERALTSGETEQRYHFNLPNELLQRTVSRSLSMRSIG